MTYSIHDWTEDLYSALAFEAPNLGGEEPSMIAVRGHLSKRFQDVHPEVPNPDWVIARLLHSYDWILNHAHELGEPCVTWDGLIFAASRWLCEAHYRIAMRLPDSELGKDMDVDWLEGLTMEQKALNEGES